MTGGGPRFTAVVLAGSRGADDPVARHAGQQNKVFVPVAGKPMLLWVLRALSESPSIGRIAVSIDDPALLENLPELEETGLKDRIIATPTGHSPGDSVLRALDALDDPWPVLVATADHPLLTTTMVEHFCASAPEDADVTVALTPAPLIRQAYPGAVRTYYRFAGAAYSGCNLYCLRTPAARQAVSFWSQAERHRKRPWRLVSAIGPITLCRFLLGRLSLEAALEGLSGLAGASVRAVELPFAEAAIDVDKPEDLALADSILKRR